MNILINEMRSLIELSVRKFEQKTNQKLEDFVLHENSTQMHKMLVEMTPKRLQQNYIDNKNFNEPALDELQNYERILAVGDGGEH